MRGSTPLRKLMKPYGYNAVSMVFSLLFVSVGLLMGVLGAKLKLFHWSQQIQWLLIATSSTCQIISTRRSPYALGDQNWRASKQSRNSGTMPGSIHVSVTQPPITAPLFLQVAVGRKEYNGNIGQDEFSFPLTSLRESMVMQLYSADRALISRAELKTKAIIESGTVDVAFNLDSGGSIILRLQFLLSDEDRKRIQEMRYSATKRKQQELLSEGHKLSFQEDFQNLSDSPSSKQHIEEISNTPRKGEQPTLRKSLSLDNLQERTVSSGVSVDPHMEISRDLTLRSGEIKRSKFEDPIDSKRGHGKQENRSSNAVKKMISAFESSSSQGLTRNKSESSLKGMPASLEDSSQSSFKPSTSGASQNSLGHAQTGVVAATSGGVYLPSSDKGSRSMSGRNVLFGVDNVPNASGQAVVSSDSTSRSRVSVSRDRANKQNMITSQSRSKKRSLAKGRRISMGPYSLEQMHSLVDHPFNYLVATSSIWLHPRVCMTTASRQLKDLLERERLNSFPYTQHIVDSKRVDIKGDIKDQLPNIKHTKQNTSEEETRDAMASAPTDGFPMLNGRLVNQGVRVVIVIIACGAIFLNV